MEDGELCELFGRSIQQVRDRGRRVLAAVSHGGLNGYGTASIEGVRYSIAWSQGAAGRC